MRWLRNRCGVPDSRFQVALVLDAPSRIVDARCFQNRCGVLDTRCDVVSASRIVDARRFRNRCGVPDTAGFHFKDFAHKEPRGSDGTKIMKIDAIQTQGCDHKTTRG